MMSTKVRRPEMPVLYHQVESWCATSTTISKTISFNETFLNHTFPFRPRCLFGVLL
jgi:hypothetical protein